MNSRIATLLLLVLLTLAGCAKKLPRADLGVDVYLHPEAAGVDDVLLQAAIRKKIAESLPGGAVHVRVIDKVIFLSGSVASDEDRVKAIDAAKNLDLRIDGQAIRPAGEVHAERLVTTR